MRYVQYYHTSVLYLIAKNATFLDKIPVVSLKGLYRLGIGVVEPYTDRESATATGSSCIL